MEAVALPSSLGVFIGRFQPFHLGHQFVVQEALKKIDSLVLVIGSSNLEASLKNPFTFAERKDLIQKNLEFFLPSSDLSRIHLIGVPDFPQNNEKWMNAVQQGVQTFSPSHGKISVIGHDKDESTYYLNLFKDFKNFDVMLLNNYKDISGSKIREAYFPKDPVAWAQGLEEIRHHISPVTEKFLRNFQKTPEWGKILNGLTS